MFKAAVGLALEVKVLRLFVDDALEIRGPWMAHTKLYVGLDLLVSADDWRVFLGLCVPITLVSFFISCTDFCGSPHKAC